MATPKQIDQLGDTFHRQSIFWGEIAPCDHVVQFYDSEKVFLDTLEGYVCGGLKSGGAVIVIATPEHSKALDQRIKASGIDLNSVRATDQYIALDAKEALSKFMVDGLPDKDKFTWLVSDTLGRASKDGRKVRAFGEMVALLWAEGNVKATLELENLWHEFCMERALSLLCAYPRIDTTLSMGASMAEIVATHTRVISG